MTPTTQTRPLEGFRRWSALGLALVVLGVLGARLPAQDGELPRAELEKLATSAKSPDDHARLAAHYNAHAATHEADAKLHEQLGAVYDKSSPQLAGEARHYAAHSSEAAEALRNLARIHQAMAK